ncbi:MAG: hypothetical protein JRH20_28280 [Deltaproteobacteria bacterium]|nr:hypothetical protein [Deltaproteobacteria bacterium]
MEKIANSNPGQRIAESVEVAPGGNSVEYYLDVVAPDDVSLEAIVAVLDEVESQVGLGAPAAYRSGSVAARFFINLGFVPNAVDAFRELRQRALTLFASPAASPWLSLEPLLIQVRHEGAAWCFSLSDLDRQRLPVAQGSRGNVVVPNEVADDFRRMHGELYPHVAEWLTGLDRDALLALGGVRFSEGADIVWEWPRRER